MPKSSICVAIGLFAVFFANVALSQEATEPHGEEHGGHEFHPNIVAGFVGITGAERRAEALTIGFEYERRFSERWGLGAGLEHAFGDLDFTILTVPFAYHAGMWKFSAGPGIEWHDGHEEFLARASAEYAFKIDGLEFAPKLSIDVVDGDAVLVLGLIIAKGF